MITKKDLKNYKGDRRSKEFRLMKEEFASQKEIRGLGDVINVITEATGIKALVKAVAGEFCGCEERREKLNNLLPRGRKQVKSLTEEEHTEYGLFMNTRKQGRLEANEVKYLMTLYTKIYNRKWAKVRCTQCALKGRVQEAMSDLDRAYNNQKQ